MKLKFYFFYQIPIPTDDYKQHTSCVTEAERYEKTVYKGPRKNETKGRKLTPQECWMELIEESKNTCPSSLSSYIDNLLSLDNVPRKERAFRNFAANSLRLRGPNGDAIITSIWKHLSTVKEEQLKAKEKLKEQAKEELSKLKSEEEPTSDEKVKESAGIANSNIKGDNSSSNKKIAKAMKKTLKKAPSKQLKVKELRKLVKKLLDSEDITFSKDEIKIAIKQAISENKSISSEGKLVKII
jgi:cell growth-regulating nucleolar protein